MRCFNSACGWCDRITEVSIVEATKNIVRNYKTPRLSESLQVNSYIYINCPNCNKRLMQARIPAQRMKAFTIDRAHPIETAELTIKCERCKNIVAIGK